MVRLMQFFVDILKRRAFNHNNISANIKTFIRSTDRPKILNINLYLIFLFI